MTEIICKKCGVKIPPNLNPDQPRACFWCDEPCEELLDLDRCDWSEGDQGKEAGG